MVAAEGEEFGEGVGWVYECGLARAELEEGGGHLLQRLGVVEGRDGDVATVEDRVRSRVWVQSAARVEATAGALAGGGGADGAGAEAGARTVGDGGVEGGTDDGDVVGSRGGVRETFVVWEVCEGGDAAEGPLVVGKAGLLMSEKGFIFMGGGSAEGEKI